MKTLCRFHESGRRNWNASRSAVPFMATFRMCDGSVMQMNTNRADLFYERDGNLHINTQMK